MSQPASAPSNSVSIPLLRLHSRALEPVYQTASAAGMDLHACLDAPIELLPGARVLIPTGWALAIPEGYEAQLRPRSGLAFQHGVTLLNSPGTIDADYRGELKVLLIHHGTEPLRIEHGQRIAQLVVAPVLRVSWRSVESLDPSERGTGGFGHTGA
ncbi:MAG: dUTP diphosphatase [Myxococcota bacterium]